jgi:hypothetical protein
VWVSRDRRKSFGSICHLSTAISGLTCDENLGGGGILGEKLFKIRPFFHAKNGKNQ